MNSTKLRHQKYENQDYWPSCNYASLTILAQAIADTLEWENVTRKQQQ